MNKDDQLCYCYHVSYRKLENFAKRTKPKRASQLTECLGAGTGCGWCIPFLEKIFTACAESNGQTEVGLTPEEYAKARQTYIKTKKPKNEFEKR